MLRTPAGTPDFWDRVLVPTHDPDGRPVERGPSFATTQEMLAPVGADIGTYPVSTQLTSHHTRPDVAHVLVDDAEPYRRRFHWPAAAETATIRAFERVAAALADPGEGHVVGTPVTASWRSAAPPASPAGEEDAPWPTSRSSTRPR